MSVSSPFTLSLNQSFTLSYSLLLPSHYLPLVQLKLSPCCLPLSFASNLRPAFSFYLYSSILFFLSLICSALLGHDMMRNNRAKQSNNNGLGTNLQSSAWPHITSRYSPVTSGQFGEWLKLWLIHSAAAGEYSSRNDAPEHPNNHYLSHYSQSDLKKRFCLCVGVWTYLNCTHTHVWISKCNSVSFHPKPDSKLANALWIIRQIYWRRADYRNEWCMLFCLFVSA